MERKEDFGRDFSKMDFENSKRVASSSSWFLKEGHKLVKVDGKWGRRSCTLFSHSLYLIDWLIQKRKWRNTRCLLVENLIRMSESRSSLEVPGLEREHFYQFRQFNTATLVYSVYMYMYTIWRDRHLIRIQLLSF